MKIMIRCGMALAFLGLLAVQTSLKAGTLINNFTGSANYVAGGIINDTNWDGVYLGSGDIFGGSGAGATTLVANEIDNGPGYLTVQQTAGNWSAAADSGFFLYKVVNGDFDASVCIVNPFSILNYHLPGILVRAYNPTNSGAPYSPSTGGVTENWIYNARFQNFGQSEHGRYATNNADGDGFFTTAGDVSDTNSTRYVRITRVGNTFSFYDKTNQSDAWRHISDLTRSDLNGVAMQVGIEDNNVGNANSPITYLSDFELGGTNVTFPVLPAHPASLVTTATNTGGSLTFSWNMGNPGDSSLVVMSRGRIQHNPVNGMVYNATNVFGNNSTLLDGAGEYVVFNGTGNSVTVTNLGANIFRYNVAVFEYTNNGSSMVYNTAQAVTNSFVGPGVINSVNLVVASTNIPVNGATALQLLANFSTGQSNVDETALATWASSAPSVATVSTAGTVSGVASGSTWITGTFGSFSPSNSITVHGPFTFADNFTSTNDYVANGLVGSLYDGLFLNFGDVPGAVAGADGNGSTLTLNSQINTTNGLYMSSVQSDWSGTANDGPFLFKIVPGTNQAVTGDFQALVHINTMNTLNLVVAGIMARCYNPANAGPGPGGSENHVNYWKVQNGTTSARRTRNGTAATFLATGPSGANGWLLIQRANSTNFYFYEKATAGAAWTLAAYTNLSTAANNAPMEVGVAQQSTAGVNGLATFDNFSVDALGMTSATTPPPAPSNLVMTLDTNTLAMTLKWVAADGSGNPVASIAVLRPVSPVNAQPPVGVSLTGNSVFGLGSNLGGSNYVVFVSANPPTSTNNTVTVTGLAPGVQYYAVVFTYAGTGTSTLYNTVGAIQSTMVDGALTGIAASLNGGIPMGGIGKPVVTAIYTGGVTVDVSSAAVVTSGNTNIVLISAGVLTGITNGTAPITNSFGGFTTVLNVQVRPPSFSDEFGINQDYLNNGVTGSSWDGFYNPNPSTNPVPGSAYTPLALSGASVVDANITSNNVLTMYSAGDGWEAGASGGAFLFKTVAGNFQMAVHIRSFQVSAYNQPGLLARGYAASNGISGWPLGYVVPNAGGTNDTGEYWVSLARFDEFGIGTYARRNVDSVVLQSTQADPAPADTNYWLMIVRSGDGSQFDFYKRLSQTNAWIQVPNKTHYSIAQLAGRPMQVGMMAGSWNGTSGGQLAVSFEHFMVDAAAPIMTAKLYGGNITVSWPAVGNPTLKSTPSISPPFVNWQTVTQPPAVSTMDGFNAVTMPATNKAMFFELAP